MKKSYEKPEVNKVKLQAEEAVLNHCKATVLGPAIPPECVRPDGTIQALTIGS